MSMAADRSGWLAQGLAHLERRSTRRQAATTGGPNSGRMHIVWPPSMVCTVAVGMLAAKRRWSLAGRALSCSVTSTSVGTSMRFTHRRLSNVPMAWPASSTCRQSCRRISCQAHARMFRARSPLPAG
jgi:hypothetical protein